MENAVTQMTQNQQGEKFWKQSRRWVVFQQFFTSFSWWLSACFQRSITHCLCGPEPETASAQLLGLPPARRQSAKDAAEACMCMSRCSAPHTDSYSSKLQKANCCCFVLCLRARCEMSEDPDVLLVLRIGLVISICDLHQCSNQAMS